MKLIALSILSIALLFQASNTYARSDLRAVSGLKFPNSSAEGEAPVSAFAWTIEGGKLNGYTDLIPFMLRSPNQEDAGSCLYMSLTGIAEFWMARLHPELSRDPDGAVDLSERYLMNLAGIEEDQNGVLNWKTDSIYLFNRAASRAALNRDYRFTKGWASSDKNGNYVTATANTPGAEYTTAYNWIDESKSIDSSKLVTVPHFERDVLFADPESNQWNVGVMPSDIIEKIKTALLVNKAPVHIIYNHYAYWHAVDIVGFDDDADTKDCQFVNGFRKYMAQRVIDLRAEANQTRDPAKRQKLLGQAMKSEQITNKINSAYEAGGGCRPKGMFYVRDSIYADPNGPNYDYDSSQTGDEGRYSKTVVMHEYDWVKYMANHATQILVR